MKKTFLKSDKPMLTVMLQCRQPELAKKRIRKALELGADAFGLQVESLLPEYRTKEVVQDIFREMQGKPVYVTNYRKDKTSDADDEAVAAGLENLADWGATLCDVMGDLFCKHPDELTDDPAAIQKQLELIDRLHSKGAEVLMSSHLKQFHTAEQILAIALEQQRRGADVVKIVNGKSTMEQQLENLRITHLLKENLKVPFLFLSGGECRIHRRIGGSLGCCMYLCVYEHDELSTKNQPLLTAVKAFRDNMEL